MASSPATYDESPEETPQPSSTTVDRRVDTQPPPMSVTSAVVEPGMSAVYAYQPTTNLRHSEGPTFVHSVINLQQRSTLRQCTPSSRLSTLADQGQPRTSYVRSVGAQLLRQQQPPLKSLAPEHSPLSHVLVMFQQPFAVQDVKDADYRCAMLTLIDRMCGQDFFHRHCSVFRDHFSEHLDDHMAFMVDEAANYEKPNQIEAAEASPPFPQSDVWSPDAVYPGLFSSPGQISLNTAEQQFNEQVVDQMRTLWSAPCTNLWQQSFRSASGKLSERMSPDNACQLQGRHLNGAALVSDTAGLTHQIHMAPLTQHKDALSTQHNCANYVNSTFDSTDLVGTPPRILGTLISQNAVTARPEIDPSPSSSAVDDEAFQPCAVQPASGTTAILIVQEALAPSEQQLQGKLEVSLEKQEQKHQRKLKKLMERLAQRRILRQQERLTDRKQRKDSRKSVKCRQIEEISEYKAQQNVTTCEELGPQQQKQSEEMQKLREQRESVEQPENQNLEIQEVKQDELLQ